MMFCAPRGGAQRLHNVRAKAIRLQLATCSPPPAVSSSQSHQMRAVDLAFRIRYAETNGNGTISGLPTSGPEPCGQTAALMRPAYGNRSRARSFVSDPRRDARVTCALIFKLVEIVLREIWLTCCVDIALHGRNTVLTSGDPRPPRQTPNRNCILG